MQKYPRTVAAIAAAGLLAAFAAQANKGAEYKPHHHHKEHHKNFFITGGATYLEPSNNGLDYLTVTTLDPASSYTEAVQPEFNWGYYLAAGYRISHHYDVQANWAQFNSSMSDSTTVAFPPSALFTTSNHASTNLIKPGESATADSKQTIDYSVFNANLGQYHNITEMLRSRIFAGIQYAKVDSDTHNTYNTPPAVRRQDVSYDNYSSSFSGVGPEIGLDLEYKIWDKFGVVSHLGAAFLIGQQDADSYVSIPNATGQVAVDSDSVTRMVPALDARLGLNWNVPYEYQRCSFGIEAGYEIAYLFDVINQVGVPSGDNYSNYGNMGPYLNLTAMF
jgi:hypothetical protein